MKENLPAIDSEDAASEGHVRIKTGKSSVTLKDRAVLNVRLSKHGPDVITLPTQWKFETTGDDR